MTFKRYENESDDELIYRICSQKEQIGSWQEVCDVLNNLTGNCFGESAYRKRYQSFKKILEANIDLFSDSSAQAEEIKELTRELNRAKVQYRDERNAWNKQNYIDGRIEQKLDYLETVLNGIGNVEFKSHKMKLTEINSDNDLIVFLSDLHIGQTFNSCFGNYDTDIAKERLNKYLDEIIKIGKRHNSENVYVFIAGDEISGSIHLSLQVTNRENVIEQIEVASEYIASFVYELSKHFKHVYVSSVAGNHSRLVSNKEKDVKDERFDDLISWIVKKTLQHINNITVLDNILDNSMCRLVVRDKVYIGIHGDNDSPNSNSIGKLCMMLNEFPYAILAGHRHVPMTNEFNGIKFVQSGSLAGSGDDYTVSKRLAGMPNQTVLVCNNKGIECTYNIELN